MKPTRILPPPPPPPPPGRRVVDGRWPEGGFIALVIFSSFIGLVIFALLAADIWLLSKVLP